MQHAEQVRQAHKLLNYLDTGTTAMADAVYPTPVKDYFCPQHAEAEQANLFKRWPLNLGLSCRVPEPGDYFEEDYSGVPILVTRGRDRQLRAFMNVCRHRGARVAKGCGKARTFTCPYHAWTYDLEGKLLPRPHEAAFEGMPRETHGLVPLPIEERFGMIWVGASPDVTIDLDAQLGGLGPDMEAYKLDGYHHYETRVQRQPLNWKLVIDTFLELYHLSTLHPTTVGPILYTDRSCFDGFGRNLRMIGARFLAERKVCWKRTLDISGDGKSNLGPRPEDVRPGLEPQDITINGLVIGADAPSGADLRQTQIGELTAYFEANVILGQDAFVEVALGYEEYADAMARKLRREIEALTLSTLQ